MDEYEYRSNDFFKEGVLYRYRTNDGTEHTSEVEKYNGRWYFTKGLQLAADTVLTKTEE